MAETQTKAAVAEREETVNEALEEFRAECSKAEGFVQALVVILNTMLETTIEGEDRARAISALRMLSFELDGIATSLEEGIREWFGNGHPDFPGRANV